MRSRLYWMERAVPPEELHDPDEKLLAAMNASLCEMYEIICHTEAIIEQTRIMMRKFDNHWPNPAAAWTPSKA